MIFKGEYLIVYRSMGFMAWSPLQEEAKALNEALDYVCKEGIQDCIFFTDSEFCGAVSTHQAPVNVDWKAYEEVLRVWKVFMQNMAYQCQ